MYVVVLFSNSSDIGIFMSSKVINYLTIMPFIHYRKNVPFYAATSHYALVTFVAVERYIPNHF